MTTARAITTPPLGQFTSADTVLDGLNRYGYVGGNPISRTDPSGQMPDEWGKTEGGGGGGGWRSAIAVGVRGVGAGAGIGIAASSLMNAQPPESRPSL